MQEYGVAEARQNWSIMLDEALVDPVKLTKRGRVSHVVMSSHEYEAYQKLKREAFIADVKGKLEEGISSLDRGEGIVLKGREELDNFMEDIKQRGREALARERS